MLRPLDTQPLVSVIIPTRNRRRRLTRCVESVLRSTWEVLDVVVVDDASDYDVATALSGLGRVRVIRNSSRRLLSYSRNIGAQAAKGSLLFFLDDDNVVSSGTIKELVETLSPHERLGVCSPIVYTFEQPNQVWTSYIRKGRFPGFYVLGVEKPGKVVPTFSFHNAFMIRRNVFESLGGFDQTDFPIHFGELDFAYRLHLAGYQSIVNPWAEVWHDVGKTHMHVDSMRSFYTLRNRIILLKKYESKADLRFYILCLLPALTIYYSLHHLLSAIDHRFSATFNLVRGVVSGIAYRTRPFLPLVPPTVQAKSSTLQHTDLPLVSVIIPTRNSASTMARCLDSIAKQTYPKIEVIVVDNFSADRTLEIARSFHGVSVYSAGPERSAQFNMGADVASGKYLYRVDSDFVAEPGVVEEAVARCTESGFKVVTVHNTSDPSYGFWAKVRKLERDCYEDDDTHIAARFFDRRVFQSVGGFDESVIASEDYDLHNRLVAAGLRIGRIHSKELHIGEPRSLKEVVLKHIFYGQKISGFMRVTARSVWVREIGPIRFAYLRHWRTFLKDPKITVGFLIYQYVRYASAIAGYVSASL